VKEAPGLLKFIFKMGKKRVVGVRMNEQSQWFEKNILLYTEYKAVQYLKNTIIKNIINNNLRTFPKSRL